MATAITATTEVAAPPPNDTSLITYTSVPITWNEALEHLLCSEAEKCSGMAWLHNKSEMLYSNRTNYLQLPIIIFSAVSGFVSGTVGMMNNGPATAIGVGAVSILVSILGTINSYFAFAKRSEGHRIASTNYLQISRTLRIEMSLPRDQRTPPKVLLKLIKDDLKRLAETAPRIPDTVLARYKREIVATHSARISHPEVTNGIENIIPFDPETYAKQIAKEEEVIAQENSNVIVRVVPNTGISTTPEKSKRAFRV